MKLERLFGSIRRAIEASHEKSRRIMSNSIDHTPECERQGEVSTFIGVVYVNSKRTERVTYRCNECLNEAIKDFPAGPERIF